MPCVSEVVSENVFRVPNDTSIESVCRMLAGFTSASAAEMSGSLARPMRSSIDATGPDDGLNVETWATVAGAPHAASTAESATTAHVTILESFTVVSGEKRRSYWRRSVLASGDVRFGP